MDGINYLNEDEIMSNSMNVPTPMVEEVKPWKNTDIIDYYENIPVDVLRDFAISGGFEEGCDIDLAYPYIANTPSIIDAGAAYGRVVKNLVRKNYQGKIYAVERSKNFCKYLNTHYADKAEVIQADIQYFEPSCKVNAILWLWSGIGDFAKNEQLPMLKRMCTWLETDGVIILETILHTVQPKNVTINQGKNFIIYSEHGTAYGYKPSTEEIHNYGEQLGFNYIKHIPYETTTQRQRILHIFSKNPI
jgi:hypothetical protein